MTQPLVSVFMPTYQHEDFVAAAIESVLAQDFGDFELVISDDHSTDATWERVQHYQRLEPTRIRAQRNATNLGLAPNLDRLLRRCRGRYVAFHAGDDLWLPGKLRTQVEFMEGEPDCAFSYHDVEAFDSDSGDTLFYWNSGPRRPQPVTGDARAVRREIVAQTAGFMSALSVMLRRDCLGGSSFDQRLPVLTEMLLWLLALQNPRSTVAYLPEVLARYRRHPGGVTQRNNETEIDLFLGIVENEHTDCIGAVRRARGRRYYTRGVDAVTAGRGREALSLLSTGMCYDVYSTKVVYWLLRAALQVLRSTDQR